MSYGDESGYGSKVTSDGDDNAGGDKASAYGNDTQGGGYKASAYRDDSEVVSRQKKSSSGYGDDTTTEEAAYTVEKLGKVDASSSRVTVRKRKDHVRLAKLLRRFAPSSPSPRRSFDAQQMGAHLASRRELHFMRRWKSTWR